MSAFIRLMQGPTHTHPFDSSLSLTLLKISKGDMVNAYTYESIENIEHTLLRSHLMSVDLHQRISTAIAQ